MGTDILRGHQSHLDVRPAKDPAKVMGPAARFHRDNSRRQLCHDVDQVLTANTAAKRLASQRLGPSVE